MKGLYQCSICKTEQVFDGEPKEYHRYCGGEWFKIMDLE